MSKVFVSYKRMDKEKVFPIVRQLESQLGIKFWIDLEGIKSDEQFSNVIVDAINQCEVFLFMFSRNHKNINPRNDWTVREVTFAETKLKRIVFIDLDNVTLPDWFSFNFPHKQVIQANDKRAMERLAEDMREWLGKDIDTTLYNDDIHSESNTTTLSNVDGFDVGYDLALFVIHKLRGQTIPEQESMMEQKMNELGLDPKLLIDKVSHENMIERLNDCAYNLGVQFGKIIENCVCLGVLFVLSVIAKRSHISEEFGHFYDKALVITCRQLNFDTNLTKRLIKSNDEEMESMMEELKNALYMLE